MTIKSTWATNEVVKPQDYNELSQLAIDTQNATIAAQADADAAQAAAAAAQSTANGAASVAGTAMQFSDMLPCESLVDGFCLPHRLLPGVSLSLVSGRVQLEYFVAPKTVTLSNINKYTGTTPQSGTAPTVIKMGVYSVAGDGALTRIAVTANDTTLFPTTNALAAKAFLAPCPFVEGQLYAVALLVVTAGTIPTIWGTTSLGAGLLGIQPRLCGQITGQTDLLASYAAAGTAASIFTFSRLL